LEEARKLTIDISSWLINHGRELGKNTCLLYSIYYAIIIVTVSIKF
jgi:hypothetical protein